MVTQESLKALEDGEARLVLLAPDPSDVDVGLQGTVLIPMTCQSEGTLAIYLEPWLPKSELVVIGQSPMARSLVALGDRLGFRVLACDPSATRDLFPEAENLVQELDDVRQRIGHRSYVVVATMGHYDEEALEVALSGQASYVGMVASPRRGRAVIDYLRGKGVAEESLDKVKYPAGLDIGAETPEEIALSILTEIVQKMRAEKQGVFPEPVVQQENELESIDPICKMTVRVSGSRYHSTYNGTTFHFCCLPCKEQFEQEPERHVADSHLGGFRPCCTGRPAPRPVWTAPARQVCESRYPARWERVFGPVLRRRNPAALAAACVPHASPYCPARRCSGHLTASRSPARERRTLDRGSAPPGRSSRPRAPVLSASSGHAWTICFGIRESLRCGQRGADVYDGDLESDFCCETAQ